MHRVDPRTKLLVILLVGVTCALVRSAPGLFLLLGAGAASVLTARPAWGTLRELLKVLGVLAGLAVLLNGLFTPGMRLPGPSWAPLWPTEAGMRDGAETALRLLCMACLAFALVTTTSPRRVAEAVDSSLGRVPLLRNAGLSVDVACRFFPDIAREAQRMKSIRSVRTGGRKLSLRSRIGEIGSMMLALVVIVVRRAERTADAMTARCYQSGAPRTAWRPRGFAAEDGLALAAAVAVCAGALLLWTPRP